MGADASRTATKLGVLPVPEAAKPIAVLELVQVKVAPAGVEVKAEAGTLAPLQTVMLVIGRSEGRRVGEAGRDPGVSTQQLNIGVNATVLVKAVQVLLVAI